MSAKRVTQRDVKRFYELYLKYGTFEEVAKHTRFSASTVNRHLKVYMARLQEQASSANAISAVVEAVTK